MPYKTSKSLAAQQLKNYLKCDKMVAFGDGKNDMDLFEIADECYAVKNAQDCLKEIATAVIHDNNHDGVAKWLQEHFEKEK